MSERFAVLMQGQMTRFMHLSQSFFHSGGAGINIEPQHGFWKKLEKDRPHDKNIEAGVSNQKGVLTLFSAEASQVFI